MLYVIHALDHPNMINTRALHIDAHRAYAKAATTIEIAISGPMLADNGTDIIGSLLIVEAPDRATAEDFANNDPLNKKGIWRQLDITAFNRRVG
ncbi:hypothetical protein KX928_01045 [Roseobacter sp. YSTF-M11]|uniref:YCII-related domain-containing protein n=1 Tax=Roseobacter insulae TaxID=2859783 RepID=A0A9X1FRL7_9RHOB|nr:YciI family protein [Roseobacter insulae]MBW4706367.1 hypothetical protein [Roseobacter insulae]